MESKNKKNKIKNNIILKILYYPRYSFCIFSVLVTIVMNNTYSSISNIYEIKVNQISPSQASLSKTEPIIPHIKYIPHHRETIVQKKDFLIENFI